MKSKVMPKKTVVLGASDNPSRYSYLAVRKLSAYEHPVVAIGRKKGQVGNIEIKTDRVSEDAVDTITLYLNPGNQVPYYDYIMKLKPKRIIFNPGTENPELVRMAEENNIEPVMGCTLVMLSNPTKLRKTINLRREPGPAGWADAAPPGLPGARVGDGTFARDLPEELRPG